MKNIIKNKTNLVRLIENVFSFKWTTMRLNKESLSDSIKEKSSNSYTQSFYTKNRVIEIIYIL